MNSISDQNRRWISTKISKWPEFWKRLGFDGVPDLEGKYLLDVGSGLGGNSYAAAKAGAIVIALEPDLETHQKSQQLIREFDPELFERISFTNSTIEQFEPPEKFDYIVCDEVFEHLLDFRSAIQTMSNLLKEHGQLCSGWGPLWRSPLGGHQLVTSLVFRKGLPLITTRPNAHPGLRLRIPYSHRFMTGMALKLFTTERNLQSASDIQSIGMNGMGIADFYDELNRSKLQIDRWIENAGSHSAYRLFRMTAKLPMMRDLTTANTYAVMSLKLIAPPG